jgi:hypothetical protein
MANQGGSHEQHVKSGQQGHKNAGTKQASSPPDTKSTSGKQGGTHEQHVKAGQQSHKNSH